MRRVLLPLLAIVALAVGAAVAPAANTPTRTARAKSVALVVQIVLPGADAIVLGGLLSRDGAEQGGGDFVYPADGSIVKVAAATTSVRASVAASRASARTATSAGAVSLLDGLVTATGVRATATATAEAGRASSRGSAVVEGLIVAGQPVAAGTNDVLELTGLGTLTIGETVDANRSAGGRRTFTVALHLRLERPSHGLPAGAEVLVGYADAGAAAPKPAPATTAVAAVTPPAPADPSPGDGGGRDTARTQAPPPGGFTRTPPLGPATRAELLGPGYVFPVVGGARFSDEFGGPRAQTGFHQGIDLFAANGTPLVAVHDGTLFRVGWNRLGGNRLWLDDGQGNYFYYAHLSAFSDIARDGAQVRAGDVIGFVGDSGDAKGTPFHVHFEIHPDAGWAVPPIAFVSAWQDATPGTAGGPVAPADQPPPSPVAPPQAVALPDGVQLEEAFDISRASGLDDVAVAAAAGSSGEGGRPVPEPDAIVAIGGEAQPGFIGLPG